MTDADRIAELESALKAAHTTIAWIVTDAGGEIRLRTNTLTLLMLGSDASIVTYDSPDGLSRVITCESTKRPRRVEGAAEVMREKVF